MNITKQSYTNLLVFLIIIIIKIVMVFQANQIEQSLSLLDDFGTLMRNKEIESGIISTSYLTLSIAIISLGTISFSIVIGMMQSLINEISYQSYSKRILKNLSIKIKYLMLMFISFSQILIYLVFDIQYCPITFSIIFILDFLIVIYIVYSLFTSLFKDFNIYSIIERNHSYLIRLHMLIKKNIKYIESKKKVVVNEKSGFIDGLYKKCMFKRLNKSLKILDRLAIEYREQTATMTEELAFIFRNSCKRNDLQFSKTTLKYVTKLIKHRIDAFWTDAKQHNELLNMFGIYEKYDLFIEKSLLPIYTSSSAFNSLNDFSKIANDEFFEILMHGKSLKYQDSEGYNSTFSLIFSKFTENITNQVVNDYIGAINDYSNSMIKLISDFDFNDFKLYYNQILDKNLYLAEIVFKKNEPISYMFLTEVQLKMFEKSMINFESRIFNDSIEGLFKLLHISSINAESIQPPATLQRINSIWFDALNFTSVSNKLTMIYNEKYETSLEDLESQSEMMQILKTLSSSLFKNIRLLAASSTIDNMIKFSFCDLVSRMAEILLIFIQIDNKEALDLYNENLRLFTRFTSFYKSDKKHVYYDLYEKFEDILTKSLSIEFARAITIAEYINFTKQVYSNIKMDLYSYRSFSNLVWMPLIVDNVVIKEQVLNVIEVELEFKEIEDLLREFEDEIKEHKRFGKIHRYDKFTSLKKFEEEKITSLTSMISEIIMKKKISV